MKNFTLIVSLILISVFFSGCCNYWFGPFPHHPVIGPVGPGIINPGPPMP